VLGTERQPELAASRRALDAFHPTVAGNQLGEQHLRRILQEHIHDCRHERNHQGMANELPTPLPANSNTGESVHGRERLRGVLRLCCRKTA
jgi:hypothetical protein